MQESTFYILVDDKETGIGITIDFEKRISSYNTHNPTYHLYKSYKCSKEKAVKIESLIKHYFKDKRTNGKSKEWFSVQPEEIDAIVSALMSEPNKLNIPSAFHGIPFNTEAEKLLKEISDAIQLGSGITTKQEIFAELFSAYFGLGIPDHKLQDNKVIVKDTLYADTLHCKSPKESKKAKIAVRESFRESWVELFGIPVTIDNQQERFFNSIKLNSGYFVAICTSRVIMPSLEFLSKDSNKLKISSTADELGLYCTFHDDWSWRDPGKTGLVLLQPKTSFESKLELWEKSFRKWVIEHQEYIKSTYCNKNFKFSDFTKAIEDIVYDSMFPLDIKSYDNLYIKYIEPYWGEDCCNELFFEYLIDIWKKEQTS